MSLIPFLTKAIKPITKCIDDVHTSDEERLKVKQAITKLENDLATKILDLESQLIKSQADLIGKEMQGGWLQRNWRPILMYVIILIIANNYLVAPYLMQYAGFGITLEMPEFLFKTLNIALGGYVIGRSGEKIAEKVKQSD